LHQLVDDIIKNSDRLAVSVIVRALAIGQYTATQDNIKHKITVLNSSGKSRPRPVSQSIVRIVTSVYNPHWSTCV